MMEKEKSPLPGDLVAHGRRRVYARVIPCVLLIALLLTVLLLWEEQLFGTELSKGAHAVCLLLSVLLPPLCFGVPFKLIDYSYWGTVEKIHVRWEYASERGMARPTFRSLNELNVFILTIRTDSGRVIQRRGIATTRRIEHELDTYHVGDRVFHLYGTPHIVVFPTEAETTLICPVCGVRNDRTREKCKDCAHTLVKE